MNLRWSAAAAAIAAALGVPGSSAFVGRTSSPLVATTPSTLTSLAMGPPADPSAPLTEQYGEGSRKYRRTVYTHDQWVKHRSPDRFVNNLSTLLSSGIYKQVGREVSYTVAVASTVCLWNAMAGGYQDFSGVMHDPILQAPKLGLPMEAFTMVSPSLGLLLVFRTNASYGRWDEARKFWGLNINHTRDLNRMATAWYGNMSNFGSTKSPKQEVPIDPLERQYRLGQVSLCTWAFVRSMKRHLSPIDEDEEDYIAEVKSRLSSEQAQALISATHRPNRALYDLSVAIEKLPMHFVRKNEINKNLSIFEDTLGGCERLLSSPVPLFYSRHTARFLALWLLTLPLGLYGPFANSWNHIMMIPATGVISVCLFGIEELSTQLEEPFTILPMQGFCDKIGMWCNEIVGWAEPQMQAAKAVETKALPVVNQVEKVVQEPVTETNKVDNDSSKVGDDKAFFFAGRELANEAKPEEVMEKISASAVAVVERLGKMVDRAVVEATPVDTLREKAKVLEEEAKALEEAALALEEEARALEAGNVDMQVEKEASSEGDLKDQVQALKEEEVNGLDNGLDVENMKAKVIDEEVQAAQAPTEVVNELKRESSKAQVEEVNGVQALEKDVNGLEVTDAKVQIPQVETKQEPSDIQPGVENREMRRMSLRERLAQIDDRVSSGRPRRSI